MQIDVALKILPALKACVAIVPDATHNDPFYHPQTSYWGEIVARFLIEGEKGTGVQGLGTRDEGLGTRD